MKNRKQLLADFYLDLLAIPQEYFALKKLVLLELAYALESDPETVQCIFERMAAEDEKF